MAYFSLPTNLEGNWDFTEGKLTVHAELVVAEMQERSTHTEIPTACF